MSDRRKGFTIIELAVVVCVLVLLLAVMLPGVNRTREQAMGAKCLSNQKMLLMGWMMYADDNEGRIVEAKPGDFLNNEFGSWVMGASSYPDYGSNYIEYQHRAVEDGALFEYVGDVDAYHCVADRRENDGNPLAFRTFSIPAGANGENQGPAGSNVCYNYLYVIKKQSELKNPSKKYVMLEEWDPRGVNDNAWDLDPRTEATNSLPANNFWADNPAFWHNKAGVLGFGDGHAELRKWINESTLRIWEEGLYWNANWNYSIPADDNDDLRWMQRGYPFKGYAD